MADDIQQAIRSLASSNPNLDPAILDQIANLYNPSTGKVEAGSNEVMSDEELDNVVGGAAQSQYQAAVSSLAKNNLALNRAVIQQIIKINIPTCW
jgi:bacteriocin-like protein